MVLFWSVRPQWPGFVGVAAGAAVGTPCRSALMRASGTTEPGRADAAICRRRGRRRPPHAQRAERTPENASPVAYPLRPARSWWCGSAGVSPGRSAAPARGQSACCPTVSMRWPENRRSVEARRAYLCTAARRCRSPSFRTLPFRTLTFTLGRLGHSPVRALGRLGRSAVSADAVSCGGCRLR